MKILPDRAAADMLDPRSVDRLPAGGFLPVAAPECVDDAPC